MLSQTCISRKNSMWSGCIIINRFYFAMFNFLIFKIFVLLLMNETGLQFSFLMLSLSDFGVLAKRILSNKWISLLFLFVESTYV